MGEGCMRRNVTVQTVIVHFYELFLKKKPPDNETIAKANKVIEKCNRHLMEHGDRYITDKVKLIETEDDYNCWMKVFSLAKDSVLSLQSNISSKNGIPPSCAGGGVLTSAKKGYAIGMYQKQVLHLFIGARRKVWGLSSSRRTALCSISTACSAISQKERRRVAPSVLSSP